MVVEEMAMGKAMATVRKRDLVAAGIRGAEMVEGVPEEAVLPLSR